MKHDLALRLSALGLGLGLTASIVLGAVPQDGANSSREQASLVEEQELLARKLARLRDSMERLVERFDAEGRVHAAKLLRDGLAHITSGDTDAGENNVELKMSGSHEELRAGQSMQAIQTQQKVIADLERLLSILMDRPDLDQLESSLEELKELGAELESLASAEQELERATEELREQSTNDAQRSLEESLQRAMNEQRQLLRKNEDEARKSGALDLEKLEAALSELLQDQRTDTAVLESWNPEALAPTEAPLEDLASARNRGQRSERLAHAAETLREAARQAEAQPEDDDLGTVVRELQALAEREARDARASGDPSTERAGESLERAAERLRSAGTDSEARADAAREVNDLAAELEAQADAEAEAAAQAREAAREALREVEADDTNPAQEAAREAGEALDRASEDPESASEATRRADQLMRQAAQDMKFLGQALSASQEQNAERSEQVREGLERLPQDTGENGQRANEALERASEAMQSASQAAREESPAAASEAAQEAREQLERAMSEVAAMREAGAKASEAGAQELAASQEQLAEEVAALEEQASEGSMSEEAEAAVEEALEEAAEAMQQAAQQMQQGQRGAAAQSQRKASEALSRASSEAQEGVTPQTPEDQAKAEDLAQEQERIEKQLYEFMERYKEREDATPLPSLSGAQQSAQSAQQSLEQGDLSGAQQEEQETQRQIEEAMAELEQEEEQYQQLRDEELLFQIAEEVTAILEQHTALSEETLEIDAERTPGKRASRGQRLRLRKVSREEAAIANRTKELRAATDEEGSLVFSELLDRIERDLTRVARECGEAGGYKSGDRVQALQDDVTTHLTWLLDALNEEMERREEEQQQQGEDGEPAQPPDGENRLVPDVAEVRLLARMEVDVIDNIEELLVLYPELSQEGDIDELLLEDIQRLAVRHERATGLFKLFRERLGLPAPGLDPSHFSAPEIDTPEDDATTPDGSED